VTDGMDREESTLRHGITADSLLAASARVYPYAIRTPVIHTTFLDDRWSARVFLKSEQCQPIGAFKIRGAANFCRQLPAEQLQKGLVTHSSGNHAAAVAFMAARLGIGATIVMPANSNRAKIANVDKWGATVELCEPTFEAREAGVRGIIGATGGTFVPPFDHEWIIAGQATAAMELIDEVPDLDYIVAPLGGGGLLSGTLLAARDFSPATRVLGAEPARAADGYTGWKSGQRVETLATDTVADGLRTVVGELPFAIIRDHVHDIVLADESAITAWMYRYWRESKMIIEPSSAVALAALDTIRSRLAGKRVGVILSGGNVDFNALPGLPVEYELG